MPEPSDFTTAPASAGKPSVLAALGSGAWGSTLAALARRNGHTVRCWSRRGSAPLDAVLAEADIVLSAVSMPGVIPTIERLQAAAPPPRVPIITATKGLDAASARTPSQLWQAAFPQHPIVVLSGPNLAGEIQQGQPAATVAASRSPAAAGLTQQLLASRRFRVYANADPLGTELGGTLKNVIAIAAGVCDGLQLGANAKAALLTRALPEMTRIGTALGASTEAFFGLSGLGDLLATCESPLSRNYRVGYGLAQGQLLDRILAALEGTAEGINTTQVLVALAQRQAIAAPIAQEVEALTAGRTAPQAAVENLMARELKSEFCDIA